MATKKELHDFGKVIFSQPSLTLEEQEKIGGQMLVDFINKEILEEVRKLGNIK